MTVSYIIPNLSGGKHFLQPPIDALYHLANLQKDTELFFIDNRVKKWNFDRLVSSIPKSNVIVVNTAPYDFSQMYHFDYRLAYSIGTINRLKEANPRTPVILVGIHGHVRPDLMLKDSTADIVVRGETDFILPELIRKLELGNNIENLTNLVVRKNGRLLFHDFIQDIAHPQLDNLPFPAYDWIDLNDYYGYELKGDLFKRLNGWAVILGSRGCPDKCNFCHNYWGNIVRYREPESIAVEMEKLQNQHNARRVFFLDPNFTINKNWAQDVARNVAQKGIKIPWGVQTRIDYTDKKTLEVLADANCDTVCYGVESLDDDVLAKMNKGITSKQIRTTFDMTKEAGIIPQAFIILGSPGETRDSIQKTIDFLVEQEVPYITIVYGLRFGSKFYEHYPLRDESWSSLLTQKGRVDNGLTDLELARFVRILRKQNVLKGKK